MKHRNIRSEPEPGLIKGKVVGYEHMIFNSKCHQYYVVDRVMERKLPGFVGYPGQKFLFISDEVPKDYRRFILGHEINEFERFNGEEGRCLKALEIELAMVPSRIKEGYISFRRIFFEKLLEFYEHSPREEFKAELRRSLEHLVSKDTAFDMACDAEKKSA
jgi:hypothetical protein